MVATWLFIMDFELWDLSMSRGSQWTFYTRIRNNMKPKHHGNVPISINTCINIVVLMLCWGTIWSRGGCPLIEGQNNDLKLRNSLGSGCQPPILSPAPLATITISPAWQETEKRGAYVCVWLSVSVFAGECVFLCVCVCVCACVCACAVKDKRCQADSCSSLIFTTICVVLAWSKSTAFSCFVGTYLISWCSSCNWSW